MRSMLIFGTMLLLSGTASAYELKTTEAGTILLWNGASVELTVDASTWPTLPGSDSGSTSGTPTPTAVAGVTTAVAGGFAAWTQAGMLPQIRLRTTAVPAADRSDDHVNVVRWVERGWPYAEEVVAMTVSLYRAISGEITTADVLLNAEYKRWTLRPDLEPEAYDVQNVIAHEAGHFFGLEHSPDHPESTMWAWTPTGETDKRTLAVDDVAAVQAILAERQRRLNALDPASTLAIGADEGHDPQTAGFGCSVDAGEAAGALWPVAALLALLVLLRRRAALASALACALLLLGGGQAQATVAVGLPLEQLAARAELVVEARLIESHARWVGQTIVTDHTLRVSRCLKGRCRRTLTLRTLGGEVDGVGIRFDGAAQPRPGDQLFVFARRRDGVATAVGLAQGLFRVDGTSGVARRDLRGLYLVSARGATPIAAPSCVPLSRLRLLTRAAARPR